MQYIFVCLGSPNVWIPFLHSRNALPDECWYPAKLTVHHTIWKIHFPTILVVTALAYGLRITTQKHLYGPLNWGYNGVIEGNIEESILGTGGSWWQHHQGSEVAVAAVTEVAFMGYNNQVLIVSGGQYCIPQTDVLLFRLWFCLLPNFSYSCPFLSLIF